MALQRRALTLIVLLLPFSLLAQQFSSAWSLGGTGIDYITQIEVDKNGDRIIAGYFSGSVKFGSTTLSSDGGVDLFIAKMDNKNSFKWVKQIGGSNNEAIGDLKVDKNGNIYVLGGYTGSVTFYDANGNRSGSHSQEDVFFVKYDSNGDIDDIGVFGFSYPTQPKDLAVSNSGVVYASAQYVLSSTNNDIIIARLHFNGQTAWVETIGGSDNDYVNHLSIDPNGYLIVAGSYEGRMEFGNLSNAYLDADGDAEGFLAVVNTNKSLEVAIRIVGQTSGSVSSIYDVLYDGSDVYLTGVYFGNIAFASTTLYGSTSLLSTFYAKLEFRSSNNSFLVDYAKNLDSDNHTRPSVLAINGNDELYLSGYFQGDIDFGSETITSAGGDDIFVGKFDTDGDIEYMLAAGSSTFNDRPIDMLFDKGELNVAGFYGSTVDFSKEQLSSKGSVDGFIVTVSDVSTGISISGVPLEICPDEDFDVKVSGTGFEKGNVFRVQLSDENGDFSSAVTLDSISSDTGGTVTVNIASTYPDGSGYRIRVIGTNPERFVELYDEPVLLFEKPSTPNILGPIKVDAFDKETYSVAFNTGATYDWTIDNGNQISGGNANSIEVQWGGDGKGKVSVIEENTAGCASDVAELDVTVGTVTTLPEYPADLALFPSPAQDYVTLQLGELGVSQYEVYNLQGQVELIGTANGQGATIDVSSLNSGVYYLKLVSGDKVNLLEFEKL